MAFPATVLNVIVELLINGTWTDITQYVQQRADISITHGRPNEAAKAQPASMTLTLNNRDGSFSPKNASGQFYPYIGRNTQVRVSVNDQSLNATAYSGFRFWGEVSAWPPQWDLTGNDVWVPVAAAGVLRRYLQGGSIGSALKRFYLLKTDATAPVALWTCEDQAGSSQFSSALAAGSAMTFTGTPGLASDASFQGTDPLPLLSKSTWTGNTGSYSASGPVTFSTPGTYSWTCPGAVTSLTSAECWGGGGGGHNGFGNNSATIGAGGGGEYAKEASVAVTPGNVYTVTVGAGGKGGVLASPPVSHSGSNGSASSFAGDAVTVTANGGGGATGTSVGAGGTGSANVTHFNGGAGGHSAGSGSNYGGGGGGGSGGSAATGNAGSNATGNTGAAGGVAVTGGGAGAKGGNGGAGVDQRGALGAVPGGGGGGGGENSNNSAAHSGGNGGSGQVRLSFTSSTTPNNVVVRFLLSVPATGCADTATIVRAVVSSGTLSKIECYYGKGGKLGFRGFNAVPAVVFDSGLQSYGTDGSPLMITLELAKSGTAIAWKIDAAHPGANSTVGANAGSLAASTIGAVSQVVVNPAGTIDDTAVGFIVLQYALEGLIIALADAVNGHDGELVADRLSRLAGELGIGLTLAGNGKNSDTPVMGPQTDMKAADLLQQCEDADQGLLYEARDSFGLGYRTRWSLSNQGPLALDYSAAVLSAVPVPQYDDSLTRNDVTASRVNGGSVNAQLTAGALSVQAPPNGVGDYGYQLQASLHADTQLPSLAAWLLTTGTVDEYRFPSVPLDLSRTEVQSLFAAIPALGIGDYFQITNPPSWIPSSPVRQLLWGYSEALNAFTWRLALNGVPEAPWETALNGNILAYTSSGTGWAGANGAFSVVNSGGGLPAGNPWPFAGKYVNNGIAAGNMQESGADFPVSPGTQYRVNAWVYSTSGHAQIGFNSRDGAHAFLSSSVLNFSPTPNRWEYWGSGPLTPNAAAVFAYPLVGTQTADGSTLYAQHIVMQPASNLW